MTALRLLGVEKTYPGAPGAAVRSVTLEIEPGRLAVLVGPSGCGKSTLLALVSGLLEPDAGDILVGGRSIAGLPPERRGVVLMGQNPLLFPHMSVRDNIAFGLKMRGVESGERARRAGRMLDLVQLPGFGDRAPKSLSGGQAQRVALARALVVEPDVLLLDEPLTSLDPELRAEMQALVRAVQRETRTTMLFVTHDREEAVTVADTMALMLAGRLVQTGRPADLFERPASREAARFFGVANQVDAVFAGDVATTAFGPLPLAQPASGHGAVAIRPEAIRIGDTGPLDARVVAIRYRGSHTAVDLDCHGVALVAHVAGSAPPEGALVRLSVPREAVWPITEPATGRGG